MTIAALLLMAASSDDPSGRWASPSGNVTIAIAPCASQAALWCGTVVKASEKAVADTRRTTGRSLVGMMLVKDMRLVGPGHWRGSVTVPDKKTTVRGALRLTGGGLEVKGCAARVICKRQVWKRVG